MRSVFSRVHRRRTHRNAQAGLTLLEIMIVIAILGLLVVIVVPRVMGAFGESKVKLSKVLVDKVAKEYYPRWSAQNADKACPDNLLEMAKAVDKTFTEEDLRDGWGKPLKFMCGDTLPAGASGIGCTRSARTARTTRPTTSGRWERLK
jgi:prepilin-type N-terminal cleavage/methylation domain-containing protein